MSRPQPHKELSGILWPSRKRTRGRPRLLGNLQDIQRTETNDFAGESLFAVVALAAAVWGPLITVASVVDNNIVDRPIQCLTARNRRRPLRRRRRRLWLESGTVIVVVVARFCLVWFSISLESVSAQQQQLECGRISFIVCANTNANANANANANTGTNTGTQTMRCMHLGRPK